MQLVLPRMGKIKSPVFLHRVIYFYVIILNNQRLIT